jgi:hypothetical protein
LIPEKEVGRQRDKYLILEAVLFKKVALQQNTDGGGEVEIRYVLKPFRMKLRE